MDIKSSLSQLRQKLGKDGEWELIPRGYHMIFAHLMGFQGFFFVLAGFVRWQHVAFGILIGYMSAIATTAGAHRLFAHRSYKAKTPLRIMLMLMQSFGGQSGRRSILMWTRDHRLHHKYCETDADPYNCLRGFFFSHIGWNMIKERPAVTEKEKTIDYSDLQSDPILAFQHKYFTIIDLLFCHAIPILIPYYLWAPSIYICACVSYSRFIMAYHASALGNSVAHSWTRKPYEKSFLSADISWLSLIIIGEGWHNFHHCFPWDYRSTDVGLYALNMTTAFIDLMAWFGLAYDLKSVPDHVVRKRAERTGDGSHPHINKDVKKSEEGVVSDDNNDNGKKEEASTDVKELVQLDKLDVGDICPSPWGWGDVDMLQEDVQETLRVNSKFDSEGKWMSEESKDLSMKSRD